MGHLVLRLYHSPCTDIYSCGAILMPLFLFPYHTDSETISYFITLNAAIVSSLGGNILRSISLQLVELLFKGTVLFPISN